MVATVRCVFKLRALSETKDENKSKVSKSVTVLELFSRFQMSHILHATKQSRISQRKYDLDLFDSLISLNAAQILISTFCITVSPKCDFIIVQCQRGDLQTLTQIPSLSPHRPRDAKNIVRHFFIFLSFEQFSLSLYRFFVPSTLE